MSVKPVKDRRKHAGQGQWRRLVWGTVHHDPSAALPDFPTGDCCPSAACHPGATRRRPRRRPAARDSHAGELLASSGLCATSTAKRVTLVRLHGIGPVAVREECIKSATPERPHATLCLVVILAGILACHGMRLAILVRVCNAKRMRCWRRKWRLHSSSSYAARRLPGAGSEPVGRWSPTLRDCRRRLIVPSCCTKGSGGAAQPEG